MPVKCIILNNQHLGMVVQWEDLKYDSNRAQTFLADPHDDYDPTHKTEDIIYPNYPLICAGFGVKCERVLLSLIHISTIMSSKILEGKVGVVVGVANKRSIAFAIAKAWHEAGAKLIFNYQGERLKDGVIKLIHENFGEDAPVYDLDVSSDESIRCV